MRLPAEQRRRQLLDVSCGVFAASGFHATAMDDIARAAGVTKPVLYQHFPSKRALMTELLEDVGRQLLDGLGASTGAVETGRERVESGFEAYYRFVTGNRAAFRLLFGASVRNDAEFAQIVDRVLHQAADLISELIEIETTAEHRRVLAHALVGVAEATSRHALSDADASRDATQLARWVSELVWFGLRGVRADEPASAEPALSAE
jgi:AcrR family transcriptional regulator